MKKRLFRKLNSDTNGGIAAYVIIMFGMAFMLYLFGFTSAYNQWVANSDINGSTGTNRQISDPNLNQGGFIDLLMNPLALLGVIGGTLGSALVISFITKNTTIWQYAIPAIILVALNIFVFPIGAMTADTQSLNLVGFPLTGFLVIFFNLFYILACVDFVRGPTG